PGGSDFVVFTLADPSAEMWMFFRIRLTLGPGESYTSDPISVTPAAMFAEVGTYQVMSEVGGNPAGPALAYEVTNPTTVVPRFTDVTSQAGVGATLPGFGCSSYTAGAAWGDVNGDGNLDLYLPVRNGP